MDDLRELPQDILDVLIVGGGLVGASLAIALDASGLRVALVESAAPVPAEDGSRAADPDERNLALARGSVNALTALGVWTHVAARATTIRGVHVSRKGEFGVARFHAAAHGLDGFGATVPARDLGRGLALRLASCNALARIAPATLVQLDVQPDAVLARMRSPTADASVRARLVVGADGTQSFVREAVGIGSERIDYAQTAFVCTAAPQRSLDGVAYERFTASGPVAVLPLGERRAGIVLTVPAAEAAEVAAFDDAQFLELLHERFGFRLGRFTRPGRRVSYPLQRVLAQRLTSARAVLVGNAAQSIHPIGAQGFNLGLRDALALAEALIDMRRNGADVGAAEGLARYAVGRRADRDGTVAFSDGLARWTAGEALPLKLLRSFGLVALDRIGPLQDAVVRRGMGFRGKVPRLALGAPR